MTVRAGFPPLYGQEGPEVAPPQDARAEHDPVNHPTHYTQGQVECIDALRSALTPEEFRGFCKGNAMKYLWRAGMKGDAQQDYDKAAWYVRAINS